MMPEIERIGPDEDVVEILRTILAHAPVIGLISPDGSYQRWCKWCGFRQSFFKLDDAAAEIKKLLEKRQ